MFASMLRTQEEEILDREGLSLRGRKMIADLETWNRRMRWYAGHVRRIRKHWIALGRPTPFRVLDVGTGAGGLLQALAESELPCVLVGVDKSAAFVDDAARRLGRKARIVEGDATALPFESQSFDLVTNTLMMHHLPHGTRDALVREAARVGRSVYLFDVEVTLYGFLGMPVVGTLLGMGRDAVHDGMLSVRRGSTLEEMRALCEPLPVRVVRVFPSALCTMPR